MTRETFAQKVAGKLGIFNGSALTASVQSQILDAYDGIYQHLKDDGLVYWVQGEDENIPERLHLSLSIMVAAETADQFNIDEPKVQRLIAQAVAAKKQICKQLASGQDPDTTEAEYF